MRKPQASCTEANRPYGLLYQSDRVRIMKQQGCIRNPVLGNYNITQLHLRTLFNFLLSPLPPGGPGEGPDCHFPAAIVGFWADPGPNPEDNFSFCFCFDLKHGWDYSGGNQAQWNAHNETIGFCSTCTATYEGKHYIVLIRRHLPSEFSVSHTWCG